MSDELQSALIMLAYALTPAAFILPIFMLGKLFGWFSDRTVTLKGDVTTKLKGEVTTTAADNIYTELAAGKHTKAAEANLEAQKIALKTAEVQERTEQTRLERVRLENKSST